MVDFSKAFDSIEHVFIEQALECFGFGPEYMDWIKLIFNDREACICLCGHNTGRFTLERGIPQGDCISGYIFILAIEFLAISIRYSSKLEQFKVKGNCHPTQLYADDLTLILKRTERNLREFLKIMTDFEKASGLAINTSVLCSWAQSQERTIC